MMRQIFTTTILGTLSACLAIAPVFAQAAPKQAVFESVSLSSGFKPDPQILQGVSGGDKPARNQISLSQTPTGACVGFIDASPDHQIKLTSFFSYLKLSVESQGDTVLVIQGPGGTWCNDDSNSQNPVIAGEWKAGLYKVWVGSRNVGEFYPYVLKLTQVQ
jgi:hypothetical protein